MSKNKNKKYDEVKPGKDGCQTKDNPKYKGKPKRGRNKSETNTNQTKREEYMNQTYGGNDLAWYSLHPELLVSASSIPFAYQPGRTISFERPMLLTSEFRLSDSPTAIPKYRYQGVCRIDYIPSIGYSDNALSAVNIAARELYADIRSKYSGNLEVDAPDLMMYMLALDSIYMLYNDIVRAYYVTNVYTAMNHYLPNSVFAAMGYDHDSFANNRMQVFSKLLECAAKIRKFAFPDQYNIFKRHMFMNSNIYADSDLAKSQLYLFKLSGWYELRSTTSTGTQLEFVGARMDNQILTADEAIEQLNDAIEALMNWYDSYTINGYIIRTFESSNWITPDDPVFDGHLVPLYSLEVLTQIQNLVAVSVDETTLDIYQDPTTNNILYMPTTKGVSKDNYLHPMAPTDVIVSLPTNGEPSPGSVIISSRLTVCCKPNSPSGSSHPIISGTEIPIGVIFYNDSDGIPDGNDMWSYTLVTGDVGSGKNGLTAVARLASSLNAYRYHPNFVIYHTNDKFANLVPESIFVQYYIMDVDNVSVYKQADIENMHKVSLYSEFNCFRKVK